MTAIEMRRFLAGVPDQTRILIHENEGRFWDVEIVGSGLRDPDHDEQVDGLYIELWPHDPTVPLLTPDNATPILALGPKKVSADEERKYYQPGWEIFGWEIFGVEPGKEA